MGFAIDPIVQTDIFENGGLYLNELSFKGEGRDWFKERFPTYNVEEIPEDGWFTLGHPESSDEAWERTGKVASRILKEANELPSGSKKTVMFVTHHDFNDFLVQRLLDLPRRETVLMSMPNVSYTVLDVTNGVACLKKACATPHLP